MEKFIQFLNFLSYKYNMSFDDLSNDFKDFVNEERENLSKSSIEDEYKTFFDNKEEELEKQFILEREFEDRFKDLSGIKSYESIKQIKEIYDQLKVKK